MNKYGFLAVGVLVGALAVSAVARDELRNILGVIPSHDVEEEFRMSVGVTSGDRPRRPVLWQQLREQVNLPNYYGKLVSVTGDNHLVVMWYHGTDGVVRNVMLDKPTTALYRVAPTTVTDMSQEAQERK